MIDVASMIRGDWAPQYAFCSVPHHIDSEFYVAISRPIVHLRLNKTGYCTQARFMLLLSYSEIATFKAFLIAHERAA